MSPVIGAIGLGAGLAGISAFSASRQASQQQAAARQAQQQDQMMQQQMQNAAQQQQIQLQQQQEMAAQQSAAQAQAAKLALGPVGDPSLKPPSTVSTSPLGDTSNPYLGRSRLLGN